jgi:hypothetical protein
MARQSSRQLSCPDSRNTSMSRTVARFALRNRRRRRILHLADLSQPAGQHHAANMDTDPVTRHRAARHRPATERHSASLFPASTATRQTAPAHHQSTALRDARLENVPATVVAKPLLAANVQHRSLTAMFAIRVSTRFQTRIANHAQPSQATIRTSEKVTPELSTTISSVRSRTRPSRTRRNHTLPDRTLRSR